MNSCHCCGRSTKHRGAVRAGKALRRLAGFVEWAVPGAVLALMPKCPACFAAYIALGTGLGLSLTAAAYLRIALIVLCIASLSWLAARRARQISLWLRALKGHA